MSKTSKIRTIKTLKNIPSRNYAISYYQILQEVPGLLRLNEPNKKFKNLEKTFYQNIANIFDIRRLKTIPWPINICQ